MLFRRQFTIMVVPDAQALLRRFHVRGGQIAGGIVGLIVLAVLACSAPALFLWNLDIARQKSAVEAERDALAARAQDVDETITELRRKLAQHEKKTERLAYLAGLEARPPQDAGQGTIIDVPLDPGAQLEQARAEAENLADRATVLDRRMAVVEDSLGRQSERLARIPVLVPARGLIGGGFGWRRDPFTGQRHFHRGLDISGPVGTPIIAPADGTVIKAERDGGYGNTLYISHGDGIVTRYGHLAAFEVRPGTKVRRGDLVARLGSSGRSTGPHLHYEVLENGTAVDPTKYMPEDELD